MARIREWMDVSEFGDMTSLLAAGWIQSAGGGAGFPSISSNNNYVDVLGNGGLYNIRCQSASDGAVTAVVTPAHSPALSEVWIRFHHVLFSSNQDWRNDQYGNTGPFLFIRSSSTTIFYFASDDDGHIVAWRGDNVELGRSLATIAINTYSNLEFHFKLHDSAGEVHIRKDGIPILSLTGQDTKPGSATTFDNLVLGCNEKQVFTGGAERRFDNLAADNAGWVGESIISALKPNAIGNTTELTASGAGDNWEMVDETPPSDADYNSTLVANKKDTYLHNSLPGAASTVRAVLTAARVARTGSDIASAYLVTRSGGTDYEDAGQPIGTVPFIISKLEEVDPDTGLPWVVGDVNTSEMGIRFDT